MVNDMEISETIRKRRHELNLTLLDIAKKVGVSEATVQRYESGQIKNLRQDKIVKLAASLDLTPAQLLGWEIEEPANNVPTEIPEIRERKKYRIRKKTPSSNQTNLNSVDCRVTNADEILTVLEKLSALHSKGVLTDDEYIDKKRELLNRL